MEKKSSHLINLKQLPPIDPFRVMSSSSNVKLSKSSPRPAPKVVKPSPYQEMKRVGSDEARRKSNFASIAIMETPTLRNVDDTSSSSTKRSDTRGNTISHTDSAHERTKKGSARSNLYEICAASHWKPPIFECCKEEGPGHQRKGIFLSKKFQTGSFIRVYAVDLPDLVIINYLGLSQVEIDPACV